MNESKYSGRTVIKVAAGGVVGVILAFGLRQSPINQSGAPEAGPMATLLASALTQPSRKHAAGFDWTGTDYLYQKVIDDTIVQYEITVRNGSAMDQCLHAGLVVAAYLQAKDEAGYVRWKQTRATDCRVIGLDLGE
jgi:hypothetical protein